MTEPIASGEPEGDLVGGVEIDDVASDGEPLAELAPARPLAPFIAGLVLVILLPLLWVFATSETGIDDPAASPLIGQTRPDIEAVDRVGDSIDFADWDGDWIVVNFFATWCVACVVEHPELVEFENRHMASGDVQMVSIAFEDSADDVEEFFMTRGGTWPVITDRGMAGEIGLEFGVAQLPETFLVSPEGVVVSRLVGGFSADQADEIMSRS